MRDLIKKICRKTVKFFRLLKFKLFYRHKGDIKKRDLALVMFGGLGDGVIALPFIKQIIDFHGKENVVVFCNKTLFGLFKEYSSAEEIFLFDNTDKYSKEWFENFKKLKGYRFEKLLDLNYSRATVKNGYLVSNILSKEKIGIKGDTINMAKPNDIDRYYTNLIELEKGQHECVNIYNFLKSVGYDINVDLYYLKQYVKSKEKDSKHYVVFAIGASAEYRIWPISKWVQIAKEILNKSDKEIIVCGSEKESLYYQKIQDKLNSERFINMCGKTTLEELINLLGNCDFAIANDSGPAHIISSTGAKGIVLLGGGFNYRFFPHIDNNGNKTNVDTVDYKMDCFGCKWICSSNDQFQCIKNIDVKEVLEKIKVIEENYNEEKWI